MTLIRTTQTPRVWTANVISLYPEMFPGTLGSAIVGKALKENLWILKVINMRHHGIGSHFSVDGKTSGGGPGMVLKPQVVSSAIREANKQVPKDRKLWPCIYLSPRGKLFDQAMARKLAEANGVTILCGRFEGCDERAIEKHNFVEVSIGDFILSGGEIAAQVLIDAIVRLIPNVVGNKESIKVETFSDGLLEYPQFTKPADWEGIKIPDILLSGNHQNIKDWRQNMSQELTKARRPDLWEKFKKKLKNHINSIYKSNEK